MTTWAGAGTPTWQMTFRWIEGQVLGTLPLLASPCTWLIRVSEYGEWFDAHDISVLFGCMATPLLKPFYVEQELYTVGHRGSSESFIGLCTGSTIVLVHVLDFL